MPFYFWLLPLLCGTCSYLHRSYPGDEHGMWLLGSAPGLWIAPFVFHGEHSKAAAPVFIAVALAAVMFAIGLAMDRFQVRKTLWGILFPACALVVFLAAILSFSSIERAISKNGSWRTYIFLSINGGVYLSVILSAVLTICARGWKGTRNGASG